MFGVDAFLATARSSSDPAQLQRENRTNPFSRGWVRNFQDFFCDSSSVFRGRPSGEALLGGDKVDYTSLFEVPFGGGTRRRGGMEYAAVADGEDGEDV